MRVYEYSEFGDQINVIHDSIDSVSYVIVGSTSFDFVVAYKTEMRDGIELTFEPVQDEMPVVMQDEDGTKWDLFGEIVEGPRKGQLLDSARSYSGYWFAFGICFTCRKSII